MRLTEIDRAIGETGLRLRGGFHPVAGDDVPDAAPGRPTATLLLIGNAGPAMWRAFAADRDPARDRLDDWTVEVISGFGDRLGAAALYPFDRPPLPFQRWAARAGVGHRSPLGILIDPDHGLWHAFRGALAFPERVDLPNRDTPPSPCADCADQPCLSACPVDAFTAGHYEVDACAAHLRTQAGADCMTLGCRARRACPVAPEARYAPDQAEFHMRAFLRAR